LKTIALVAQIPRPEDGGNDAFATLLRPEGKRRLIPDLSFLVQLKAASITSVPYTTRDEMAWIRALEVPLFIGRVDVREARIELFTTQRLHEIMLENDYAGIELLLDPADETPITSNVRRAYLGVPVHAWSMAETRESDFMERSHAAIRPHIETLRRNRLLRGIQTQVALRWETGKPPIESGEMTLISPHHDITDTLREMAPHARRLLVELVRLNKYGDFLVMLAFFDFMRRWGADPDPSGALRMVAGCMAQGPEIPIEDAIRLRHAFHPNLLDLSRLPLTTESLAFIPDGVSKLALVDTPLGDEAIEQLLRLRGLSRLNLAGTKITDEGLELLAILTNLEWACVHRTNVTAEGADRLRRAVPGITVLFETEP
jgi:hypothetical protein